MGSIDLKGKKNVPKNQVSEVMPDFQMYGTAMYVLLEISLFYCLLRF